MGQPCVHGRLSRRVLPRASSQNLAEDDFIDLGGVDSGLLKKLANHRGAQVDGRDVGQRALKAADSSASGGDDDDVLHDLEPQEGAGSRGALMLAQA